MAKQSVREKAAQVQHGRDDVVDLALDQAMLLEWLGQAPVTIHRPLIALTGNVLSALWLSYALNVPGSMESTASELVIEMTSKECEAATGISRAQQITCRKLLVNLQILVEETRGRRIAYRIRVNRILELLRLQAAPLAAALRYAQGGQD